MAASVLRNVYQGARSLGSAVKDANRARQIAMIVTRHGFAQLLEERDARRERLQAARAEVLSGATDETRSGTDLAGRVVSMIEELGPTFVKFGQILSTRPDLIPPLYIERMQSLQDRVVPVPIEVIRDSIRASLGAPPEELYARFDVQPLASASIAQVHTALTHEGREVVVKVQRPNLRPILVADLSLLRLLVKQVTAIFPELAILNLSGMVSEFETSLLREIDFTIEQQSLARVTKNFAHKPRVHVPQVVSHLSSDTVITMERIVGIKLTAITDEATRVDTATLYLDTAYQMAFKDGFFHGDLHPGNVFLEPDGRLGLIDFGMVGHLSRQRREQLVDILFALLNDDIEGVARTWYLVCHPGAHIDYAQFEQAVVLVLETHVIGRDVNDLNLGAFFSDLGKESGRLGVHVPSDFTMLFKAMSTTEGLARQIAAGINPIEAARPYIKQLVRDRYSVKRLRQVALIEGAKLVDLARDLPYAIERIVSRLERGELALRVEHDGLDDHVTRLVRAANRASIALISAAASITGALSLDHGTVRWLDVSPVSFIAFSVAAGGLIWIATGIVRQR